MLFASTVNDNWEIACSESIIKFAISKRFASESSSITIVVISEDQIGAVFSPQIVTTFEATQSPKSSPSPGLTSACHSSLQLVAAAGNTAPT